MCGKTLDKHFESVFEDIANPDDVARLADLIATATKFEAPNGSIAVADTIAGFSFGWHRLLNGNVSSGPLNELLAVEFKRLALLNPKAKLVAQFEIGELVLGGRPLSIMYPELDDETVPRYLSTIGGFKQMLEFASAESLGRVAVVAHAVHAPRVCWLGQQLGLNCYVPDESNAVTAFDDHPAQQPWCRSFLPFALHSVISMLVFQRSTFFKVQAPSTREN